MSIRILCSSSSEIPRYRIIGINELLVPLGIVFLEIGVSERKIQELKIFTSAIINNVSRNVRTESIIRDIRRAGRSVQNLNRFSGSIRKGDTDQIRKLKKRTRNRLSNGISFSFCGSCVDIEIRCNYSHDIIGGKRRGIELRQDLVGTTFRNQRSVVSLGANKVGNKCVG